jgi:hypothetical protein
MNRNLEQLQVKCYLTVKSNGAVRVTKNRPGLDFDEITVGLSVSLPMALFQKPQLHAALVIPPDAAMPSEIPVDVLSNVQQAVSAATGLEVRVSMEEQAT